MLVEFTYGWWTNSLGLITDAFHMFFDCSGTYCVISVYASVTRGLQHWWSGCMHPSWPSGRCNLYNVLVIEHNTRAALASILVRIRAH